MKFKPLPSLNSIEVIAAVLCQLVTGFHALYSCVSRRAMVRSVARRRFVECRTGILGNEDIHQALECYPARLIRSNTRYLW